jgi:hypothetical protein
MKLTPRRLGFVGIGDSGVFGVSLVLEFYFDRGLMCISGVSGVHWKLWQVSRVFWLKQTSLQKLFEALGNEEKGLVLPSNSIFHYPETAWQSGVDPYLVDLLIAIP